jgi:hypothetical protein
MLFGADITDLPRPLLELVPRHTHFRFSIFSSKKRPFQIANLASPKDNDVFQHHSDQHAQFSAGNRKIFPRVKPHTVLLGQTGPSA